jgi:hypothetical protein
MATDVKTSRRDIVRHRGRFTVNRTFTIPRHLPVWTLLDTKGLYGQYMLDVPYATTWEPIETIHVLVAK